MKQIIAAIALLAAAMPALAGEIAPTQFETLEHRILVAEVMTDRLTNILNKAKAACVKGQALAPKESDFCTTQINGLLPKLKIIRQVAASGDNVMWASAVELVHKLETEMEGAMRNLASLDLDGALRALRK